MTQPNIFYAGIPNNAIVLNNMNNPSSINNYSNNIYNINHQQKPLFNNNFYLQNQIANNNLVNNNYITSYYNQNTDLQNNQNNQYLINGDIITNNNANNTNNVLPSNNTNSLVPYNNGQINNQNNQKSNSTIQSNDFWQKIDNRKMSQNTNSSSVNTNQNNNNNNNNHSDPMNQVLDDFFGDFFNNETPNHQITTNHVQATMGQPSLNMEPHMYFHSFFSPFGIHHGVFQQNYASNFGRQLARLIELSQRQRGRSAHPPATVDALKKLKRFNLEERFCKKINGKMELPNCCICQSEIEIGNQTVLLPCGHMYHWDCCLHWLKTNNTCPICRFEIK